MGKVFKIDCGSAKIGSTIDKEEHSLYVASAQRRVAVADESAERVPFPHALSTGCRALR